MVFGFLKRRRAEQAAYGLYLALVEQSRQPEFYTDYGVTDDVDGRFDMIALHATLVIRRLVLTGKDNPKAEEAQRASQALFDLMFDDMDRNLREMGVTDLGVGKQVKKMAKAYYGRAAAYEEGLAEGTEVLEGALKRNLYRKTEPEDWQVAAIATYALRVAGHLAAQADDDVLAGKVAFPAVVVTAPAGDAPQAAGDN